MVKAVKVAAEKMGDEDSASVIVMHEQHNGGELSPPEKETAMTNQLMVNKVQSGTAVARNVVWDRGDSKGTTTKPASKGQKK